MKQRISRSEFVTFGIAVSLSLASLITIYLRMSNWIPEVPGDVFYDADTVRTQYYLENYWSSLTYIRPALIVIALLGHPISLILSTYLTWLLFTVISFCVLNYSIIKIAKIQGFASKSTVAIAATANFTALSFMLIPDTFLLSAAMYFLGIYLLQSKQGIPFIALSFVVACGTNLFFAAPWSIYFLWKKRLRDFWKEYVFGALSPLTLLLCLQWVAKRLSEGSILSDDGLNATPGKSTADKPNMTSTVSNFIGSSDALKWLHNPLENLSINIVSYLSSPWTVSYRYEIGQLPTWENSLPFILTALGIALTVLSFFGLWRNRTKYGELVALMFITEACCLFLFVSYGTHPYLFSPFLIASRALGLLLVSPNSKTLSSLLLFSVPILALITQHFVFI